MLKKLTFKTPIASICDIEYYDEEVGDIITLFSAKFNLPEK